MANGLIYISSGPSEENLAQTVDRDFSERNLRECRAFMNQLRRIVGKEPEGAHLSIKREEHDFGPYRTVVCVYDENNSKALAYALQCESAPVHEWDDIAKMELSAERPHPLSIGAVVAHKEKRSRDNGA